VGRWTVFGLAHLVERSELKGRLILELGSKSYNFLGGREMSLVVVAMDVSLEWVGRRQLVLQVFSGHLKLVVNLT
jgi:hypothetical protein